MELKNKKVLVIGLGRTGAACARFLSERGALVTVNDRRLETELKESIALLAGLPIDFRLGGEENAELIAGVHYLIPSPGVAADHELLREAGRRGIPILSEIELAYRFFTAPVVAVTGTNGKSTTTTLIGEVFKASGRKVFVGGNLGTPFISAIGAEWAGAVLEISSFQLEWVERFRPQIAVLLNVSEDHLDRYASFDEYRRAKERIFDAQTGRDFAVLNRDDRAVWALRERLQASVASFGFSEVPEGVFAEGEAIVWREGHHRETYSLERVRIHGVHNIENMMAAIAVAKLSGIAREVIQQTLESFPGLEHRLEFVREKAGVRYYNDSKGTNVGAVVKSLAGFSSPVILLAGGVDKRGDYGPLEGEIRRTVRRLVLFGAAREVMARALSPWVDTVVVDDLEAAVREAAAAARPGEVVLLSPACSSFDQFRDYAERGETFKALVESL